MSIRYSMIPEPYNRIVQRNFHFLSSITDENLTRYFESCFNDVIEQLGLYPSWVCVKCMRDEKFVYGWGRKPSQCPSCGSPVYAVGTFQGRAPIVGEMFEWAFYHLISEKFKISMTRMPKQSKTHDFEVSYKIGIEAKGSAEYILNPDGSRFLMPRAGLLRSDTEKKAFANGKEFKRKYPDRYFYIVTNVMPDRLIGYKNRDINGIYDLTKSKQLKALVDELVSKKAPNLSEFGRKEREKHI